MKVSLLTKLICVLFTLPGAILFLAFAGLLNIFIFEIETINYINFNIPTISKNDYFSLDNFKFFTIITGENIFLKNILKAIFNISMIFVFWIQHIILSNKTFKRIMEEFFHYHAFERGFFNLSK